MIPKEHAHHLVNEFYNNNTDYIDSNKDAKESAVTCSIIAVDEIIKIGLPLSLNLNPKINHSEYWYQVKNELEKM